MRSAGTEQSVARPPGNEGQRRRSEREAGQVGGRVGDGVRGERATQEGNVREEGLVEERQRFYGGFLGHFTKCSLHYAASSIKS